jgi:hypothetical protein
MSARIIEILAAMAMKKTLGPLHVVSENQKTISTVVLERHLDRISDDLGGYAHSLRIEYDTLRTANQRLEGEVKALIVLLDRAAVVAGLYGDSLIGRAQQDEGYKMLDFERELRDALAALRDTGEQP